MAMESQLEGKTAMSRGIIGQSEMAVRIRNFAWESTPLGGISQWSELLLNNVNMMLSTRYAILLLWGPEMVLIYNDGFLPILTDRHPQALGAYGREFWTDVWPVVGNQLEGVLREGTDVFHENALVPILRNGVMKSAYFNYSYSPVYECSGAIAGIITICQDVTATVAAEKDRALAEKALLQSEKLAAVGRLAASIAHEINNPLEAVTNLLFLARNSESLDVARGYLDTADHELRRMAAITTQTLSFNKQATKPRSITCKELLAGVISVYQSRLRNTGVIVEQQMKSDQPVMCFDGEIRQVLNNLVSNAIDSMRSTGGRLLLRSRTATNWKNHEKGLTITVADTGKGMDQDILKRIFEPFFTTKGYGGTGLGLWVSRDIVTRHNGSLRIRSCQRKDRRGTVCTMFLPFSAATR
ncbi:MAG TPA: ATP-binding protein [Candidatus Angelobacter sp.]|jgi:nitrogen-specific signal transduction histidine kinase